MIKKYILSFILLITILFVAGCSKKETNPTSPPEQSDWFSLDIKLNKKYTFHYWELDSLNNKIEPGDFIYSQFIAKLSEYQGKKDVFMLQTYYSQNDQVMNYYFIENRKDLYLWQDTAFSTSKNKDIKFVLKKLLQQYAWLPEFILSKGTGIEYVIMPSRTILNTGNGRIDFELKAKNDGFENLVTPLGNIKTYRIKQTLTMNIYLYNQLYEQIMANNYLWISDDLDWIVKRYTPTVKSKSFGTLMSGYIREITSVE